MRRNRRMVLIDRIIPFLAALVGLIALAGSVVVQTSVKSQNEGLLVEVAQTRAALDLMIEENRGLARQVEALDARRDDGTAEALLALQDRMVKLEDTARMAPLAAPAPLDPAAATATAPKAIDPDLPTKDCIPLDTRFMVTPGESFPICQSRVVVKAASITSESVMLDNGVSIAATGFSPLPGTDCTAMVLSADISGFAEMRVNCK